MNVIFKINSREALPVRAIPFVTGWMMSPDVVAKTFSRSDHWTTKLENIKTYQLQSGNNFSAILPKEWDGVMIELEYLSNKWQMDENFHGGNYTEWRKESIPKLPARCFVWKDEFETAFHNAYSKDKLILIDEREGERDLNFTPLIPEISEQCVIEGFESFLKQLSIETEEKQLLTRERETALKLILGMAMAGYKYNPDDARNAATIEIIEDLDRLGLKVDVGTLRRWLKEAKENFLPSK